MNVIKADITQPILLGRQGEHGATQVVFDLSGYIRTYGDGVAQLAVKRAGDPMEYVAVLTQVGDTAMWEIGPEWTERAGQGYCYLHWFVDDDHAKTDKYKTFVQESKSACVDVPEPQTGYLDQVLGAGTKAAKAAESAELAAEEVRNTAKRFDNEFTEQFYRAAQESITSAEEAKNSASAARDARDSAALYEDAAQAAADRAESYAIHQPAVGENGNWWQWDGEKYVDTGKSSRGEDAEENVFVAEYGVTTYDEIAEASAAGKAVFCKYNNAICSLYTLGASNAPNAIFAANYGDTELSVVLGADGEWSYVYTTLQRKSNMTGTISSESTNSQYPSAKAVYEYGQTLVDAVLAALPDGDEVSY